jgi:hypothetical protein
VSEPKGPSEKKESDSAEERGPTESAVLSKSESAVVSKLAPEQLTQAIEKMPPPVREIFEMMAVSATTLAVPPHPLLDNFKDEHVKQFLDNDRIETANDYKLRSSNRWFYLAYFIIIVFCLGLLIWFLLPQHKDLLADLLKVILAFAGGVTSGFGLKAQLDKKKAG